MSENQSSDEKLQRTTQVVCMATLALTKDADFYTDLHSDSRKTYWQREGGKFLLPSKAQSQGGGKLHQALGMLSESRKPLLNLISSKI